jgi:hypothetical protein
MRRLLKGYGETHRRGLANFLAIFDALVENPADRRSGRAGCRDPQGARRGARRSGGLALERDLGRRVLWMKSVTY